MNKELVVNVIVACVIVFFVVCISLCIGSWMTVVEPVEMTVTDIKTMGFSVAVELDNYYVITIHGNQTAWLLVLDIGTVLELPEPNKRISGEASHNIKVVK